MMYVFQRLARMFRGANTLSDESVETVIGSKSELLKYGFVVGDDGSYCLINKDLNNLTFQDLREVHLVFVKCHGSQIKFSKCTFDELEFHFCGFSKVELTKVLATKFHIIDCRHSGLKIVDSTITKMQWVRVSLTGLQTINSNLHWGYISGSVNEGG